MPETYWTNGSDEIIVDGSDQPIDCAACPCDIVPPCCNAGALPATATATYTINALAPAMQAMSKVGSGYLNDTLLLCDLGDGRQILIDIAITCSGDVFSLLFSYSVYTSGVLGNFVQWSHTYPAGTTPTDFAVSCSPFHMHFEGTNTSGNDADGATLACGGVTYPFTSSAGVVNLVLDIVTP